MSARRTDQVSVVVSLPDTLGEGPLWSGRDNALYWVDIDAGQAHALGDGSADVRTWQLPSQVGCLALRATGGAVVALRTGLHLFDFGTGELAFVCDPESDRPGNRFNDGACDPAGRFWAGTLEDAEREPLGGLYRLDADGRCRTMLDGVFCSNGIGWSPDARTMYYTDSGTGRIDAFDYDVNTGEVHNRRVFAVDPAGSGVPDGLTVDADGYVWSAKWDGWRIVRYAPDGRIDRTIPMPVPRPTACAFGGPDLDRLYVTSARTRLGEAELAQAPLSGALFVVEPGVRGRAEPMFAG